MDVEETTDTTRTELEATNVNGSAQESVTQPETHSETDVEPTEEPAVEPGDGGQSTDQTAASEAGQPSSVPGTEELPAGEAEDAASSSPLGAPPDADLDRAAEPSPEAEPEPVMETGATEGPIEIPAGPTEISAVPPELSAAPPQTGPRTVGRFVADALHAAGVRYAFTVPGESFLGLLEGFGQAGIRVVTTRHEGAAGFMADAYGQLTGRPGACLATRAVGAANLAIGIHTARANSTPVFVLVGQVVRGDRGREAFQEVDQVETFGRLAKWAVEPRTTDEVPAAIADATRQALGGRPGPVLISLPEDLLDEELPGSASSAFSRPALPRPETNEIRAVLQLLASARRPVILAGAGVLRARTSSDLTRLAELLHVPVVAAWRRGDVMSNEHPLYLGMAGLGAPSVVRERLERADAMLVIGSRLNEVTSYGYSIPGADTRYAHVDLAPRDAAGDLRPPDLTIESDARSFLRAAVQRLRGAVLDAALVDVRRSVNDEDRRAWEEASVVDSGAWDGPGVHPGRVIATLRRVLPDEAIVTTDAGNFAGWAARGFRFRRPGTFLGPTSGAMGYGLPAAIAAALAHRDRPVVALVGDGGIAMSMAEIETAVREGTRVIVVVFDNERYGTIRMHQDRRASATDREPQGTDLGPIDFAAVARACGARGARVETDDAFEPALRQALASDRPTLLHLVLDRRWMSVDERPSEEDATA
jgi:acetolactate synthase-1/2/3 large subunit